MNITRSSVLLPAASWATLKGGAGHEPVLATVFLEKRSHASWKNCSLHAHGWYLYGVQTTESFVVLYALYTLLS